MRIFVTGGTGFIGRALTLRLLGAGHEVSAWVRDEDRAKNLLGADVQLIAAAGGAKALAARVAQSDAVINLAGEPILGGRWTAYRQQALRQSRIETTRSIADAIIQSDRSPAVLVSASAVGYYGDRGDESLNEDSTPGGDFLARLCQDWEASAQRAEQVGVRVFIPRFGIVLGGDGGALAQMLPAFQFGAGGPIASGRQWMPWIHLFDLVEILVIALDDDRYRGVAVAAAPNPVTSREFAKTLGRVLHRPSLIPVPALALRAIFGDGATVLTAGQRALPARLSQLGFKWRFDRLETALRNILLEDNPDIGRLTADSTKPENPHASNYLERNPPAYVLRHTTRVNASMAEVFSFFSRPQNLGAMTPARMRFRIVSVKPAEMSRGTQIEYTLRVGPIPLRWSTLIEVWQPPDFFADYQEQGPYRCWWHEHHFQSAGATTVMEDRVYFAPPLGVVGRAAGLVLVMPSLHRIFRFRAQAIQLRFRAVAR
jgi:uncharacterized protein (TIGR01777 family)